MTQDAYMKDIGILSHKNLEWWQKQWKSCAANLKQVAIKICFNYAQEVNSAINRFFHFSLRTEQCTLTLSKYWILPFRCPS